MFIMRTMVGELLHHINMPPLDAYRVVVGHRVDQRIQCGQPVVTARRQGMHADGQLPGVERTRHIHGMRGVGQAQQVDVVVGWIQRSREQYQRIRSINTGTDEVCWHDIA